MDKRKKNRKGLEKWKVTSIDNLQYPSTLHSTLTAFLRSGYQHFPSYVDEETSPERSLL